MVEKFVMDGTVFLLLFVQKNKDVLILFGFQLPSQVFLEQLLLNLQLDLALKHLLLEAHLEHQPHKLVSKILVPKAMNSNY